MNTQSPRGFTIIEVMLFLAVSGALAAAILVGSSAVIGQQRYRDSVHSFKGLIQEQYGQVANVMNGDTRNPICSESGGVLIINEDDSARQTRGTSECVILGRFMLVRPEQVTVYNVIAKEPDGGSAEGSDVAVLGSYSFTVHQPEEHAISWRARLVEPGTSDDVSAGVLIVRSPLSGAVLTYVKDVPGDMEDDAIGAMLAGMISDGNMTRKEFCVDSQGMSGMGSRLAVRINERASNQSAVEVPLETEGVCD